MGNFPGFIRMRLFLRRFSRLSLDCVFCTLGMMCIVKPDGPPQLCKTDEIGEICVSSRTGGMMYFGLAGVTKNTFEVFDVWVAWGECWVSYGGWAGWWEIYLAAVGSVYSGVGVLGVQPWEPQPSRPWVNCLTSLCPLSFSNEWMFIECLDQHLAHTKCLCLSLKRVLRETHPG